jgi:hypothetical protein
MRRERRRSRLFCTLRCLFGDVNAIVRALWWIRGGYFVEEVWVVQFAGQMILEGVRVGALEMS